METNPNAEDEIMGIAAAESLRGELTLGRAKELVRTMEGLCDVAYTEEEVSSLAYTLLQSIGGMRRKS